MGTGRALAGAMHRRGTGCGVFFFLRGTGQRIALAPRAAERPRRQPPAKAEVSARPGGREAPAEGGAGADRDALGVPVVPAARSRMAEAMASATLAAAGPRTNAPRTPIRGLGPDHREAPGRARGGVTLRAVP
jgi:hypothetical protein